MFEKLRLLKPWEIENGAIEDLDEIRQMLTSNIHLDPEIKEALLAEKFKKEEVIRKKQQREIDVDMFIEKTRKHKIRRDEQFERY